LEALGRSDGWLTDDYKAVLAGAEALRMLREYDTYMQSHYSDGPTSSALHPDAAKMWSAVRALLAKGGAVKVDVTGYDPRQPYQPLPCRHCGGTHNPWMSCEGA
jgi:hypothetical protein